MVLYKSSKGKSDPAAVWKLEHKGRTGDARRTGVAMKAYLAKRKFQCPAGIDCPRVLKLYARCQRGLPSYDGYSKKELRDAIARKFLILQGNLDPGKADKGMLVKTLERADDDEEELGFRLAALPPEVRLRMYRHYFRSIKTTATDDRLSMNFSMPPISTLHPQICDEVLPEMYSTFNFVIGLKSSSGILETRIGELAPAVPENEFALHADTALWLSNIRPSDLARIRRICIVAIKHENQVWVDCHETFGCGGCWSVDFDRNGGEVVTHTHDSVRGYQGTAGHPTKQLWQAVTKEIEAVMDEVATRPGINKLQVGDLDTLIARINGRVYELTRTA